MLDNYWKPFVEEIAQEIGNSPTIIYVDSKKSAIDLTTSFNQHSQIKAAAYTGEDTSKSDKKAVLSNWTDDELTLVIATSAFGLGVNKSNVRYVYHVGVPPSLEAWIQEAGRGGRDGGPCKGILNNIHKNANTNWLSVIPGMAATVLYEFNLQILEFYMKGKDEIGRERMKSKFSDVWK